MPSDLGLFRKTPRQLVKSIQPTATVSSPEQTSHLKQFPWNKCHCTVPSWWQYMLELLALSESLWIANSGSHNCSKGLIKCRIKWQIKANQTPCRRYRKISCFQMGEGTYQIILLLLKSGGVASGKIATKTAFTMTRAKEVTINGHKQFRDKKTRDTIV